MKLAGVCTACGASMEAEVVGTSDLSLFLYCTCTGRPSIVAKPDHAATPMDVFIVPSDMPT